MTGKWCRGIKISQVLALGLFAALATGLVDDGPHGLARAEPVPDTYPKSLDPAQVKPSITYKPESNTIEVRNPGAVVTLTDIAGALRDNRLLERAAPFEWQLKVHLRTFEQVRLELHGQTAGGDVNWLKLRSEPSTFATIESSNGQISIRNTRITSWNPGTNSFDNDFLDGSGRSFIAAKNRRSEYTDNRMDVIDSEIAYLGFFEETAYGISWKVISEPREGDTGILGRGITGTVTGSKFHHNYFGMYVWGTGDLQVRKNEFYNNYSYGFDAHTGTRGTILEDNFSHDNGTHGIIFAERCTSNVIRRNKSTNNGGHGIMLHELSDNNTIEDNEVSGNDDGIALFESSNSTIARNIIRDNTTGIRVYGRANNSSGNLFEDNEVSGSSSYGVFMYDAATRNTFLNNRITANGDSGVYLKSVADNMFTKNEISGNEFGVRLDSPGIKMPSSGNQFEGNVIQNNRLYGLYSYPPANRNTFRDNSVSGNGLGNIFYSGGASAVSSGNQGGIIKVILFAAIVVVAIVTGVIIYFRNYYSARRSKV
ncbi:MAG: right-handed parallel beta-helix repeat-containing protein [Chloroflexi bacterium]|nr:right-handed parallel beta-helix repeat-containing protein [Chloroflexota bacterium]